jgi:hypothetical protein
MINLKKHDNVADAVKDILQQEALKGNQGAIDANHNGEVDREDFKILRAKKKKVEEEIDMDDRTKDTLVGREKTKQKDDVGPNSNAKVSKFKLKSEEAEQIDEKNVPTSPEKWAKAKAAAKSKFSVYPSAYANGWASKKYKSMGGSWHTEEVEQIDELSINTLTRVKHAATSAASDASREGDEGKATKRYDLAGKASNKIETKNRALGLKPSGQHAFEEVEQIHELSKDTLGSYLDKKKSEYMKGKTQSGSKENAKDIQNMGKAHDKMKKEETQFNDHEKGAAQRLRDMRKNEKEAEKMDKQYQAMRNNKQKQGAVQRLNDMGKNEKEAEKMDKQYQAMRNKKTLKQMKERLEEPILDELIYEVMSKDASAGDWIHDFVHSDNPKFAGKSNAKRKEMALAAYYSKKNEEAVNEGLKDMAKKTFKALTGGSDKDHLDRLKKDIYGGSEVKYAAKTLVKHAKDPLGLKKEELEQAESESLIENFEMINEVSLGAKIKAYASHSSDAFEHGDMGNDEESEHHNARAEKIHAHILKHHGVEAANHAEKAANSAIFGNGKHKSIDSLSGGLRGQHSKSMTKSGKIPKNTQSAMKNSVKGSYGKRIVGPKGHLPEEFVEEGWDDMVKAAQEKVKSGPKPSGGSGKKEGSRYGGSKQKEKPEQEVKEAKDPNMDAGVGSQPNFVTDSAKPMQHAQSLAKKSLAKMRSDMMAKKSK